MDGYPSPGGIWSFLGVSYLSRVVWLAILPPIFPGKGLTPKVFLTGDLPAGGPARPGEAVDCDIPPYT